MRHTCEHCFTRYEIPDDKVRGRRVKVRCRACEGVMFVVGPGAPALVAAGHEAAAYFVAVDRQPRGPLSAQELIELAHCGVLGARSLVWTPGFLGWKRVIEASELRWLYDVVLCVGLAERQRGLDAFDRAALLSDGAGYFPDPTLKSGIILLDQGAQKQLETLARQRALQAPAPAPRPRSLLPHAALAASLGLGLFVGATAFALGLGQQVPALSSVVALAARTLAGL